MHEFLMVARYVVFGLVALAAAAATSSWLVRTRRVSPFTPLGRGLRGFSDPFVKPVEARVLRAGGNPVSAGWWLVIGVAVLGIVALGVLQWLLATGWSLAGAAGFGPRALIAQVVQIAYGVIFIALLVRVFGSWFGVGRHTPWMRPAYWLTDWLVQPIRRVLPPFGMMDFSPLVAVFVLWVIRAIIFLVL
jgi:YggT family protein